MEIWKPAILGQRLSYFHILQARGIVYIGEIRAPFVKRVGGGIREISGMCGPALEKYEP